ncbi:MULTISPECIES: hypothetical protein [Streptomyces]|uniref:Uncharacterized protein n=1 Tax=Streptomyces cremeus TaxID=66881 RepID=A0ABV5PAI0_STRCM
MTSLSTALAAAPGPELPVAAQVLLALFFAYAVLNAAARYLRRPSK